MALPAVAQTPVFSVAGGFDFSKNDEGNGHSSLSGWYLDPSYSVTKHVSLAADFASTYGTWQGLHRNQQTYAGGLQFTFQNSSKITPLFYTELGDSRSVTAGFASNAFMFEGGGGANVKLAGRLSLQLIPVEWDLSRSSGQTLNSYTAKIGVSIAIPQK